MPEFGTVSFVLFLISDERLSDFNIYVGNEVDANHKIIGNYDTCAYVEGQLGLGETRTIQCSPPRFGRYASLVLDNLNYLTICEFKVHGLQAIPEAGKMQVVWLLVWLQESGQIFYQPP